MLSSYARILLICAALIFSVNLAMAQTNSKQATDAAKKHQAGIATPAPVKPAAPAAKSSPQSNASVARRLDACKKDASWNVVKREQCVWDLCKGRWGKHGCPAEASSKPTNAG